MLWFNTLAFSLLSQLLSIHLALLPLAQGASQSENARTVTIAAENQEHSFTLRVSAKGRTGLVEVRNGSGTLVETLTCSLLRDINSPSEPEMKAVAEKFVTSFETEDLDFDGYMDLKGPREFGAKWARYCVWFYDPTSRTFSGSYAKRPLAEQMELLYNLTADPQRRRIISFSIGPVEPMQDEYQIEGLGKDRPYWPRLIPVPCFTQTGLAVASPGRDLPAIFTSVLPKVKAKTRIPVLLPAELSNGLREAKHAVVQKATANGYAISLYYKLGMGDAGFAADFAAEHRPNYNPSEMTNIRAVKLVRGVSGFFRPVSCGGSCAPANLWWKQGEDLYQIQLQLPSTLHQDDQQKIIVALADSAILAGPR